MRGERVGCELGESWGGAGCESRRGCELKGFAERSPSNAGIFFKIVNVVGESSGRGLGFGGLCHMT